MAASENGKLHKPLGLFDVFAIGAGATLSGGLFLLPGPAATLAGPAILLCYVLVAIPLMPAVMCIVELSTAMPRAGGIYFFLDRSLGPLAGTIGGVGTWLTLVLKNAFALVGLGAYVSLYLDSSDWMTKGIAAGFALFFGWLNLAGSHKAGGFQRVLVIGLLLILGLFMAFGLPEVEASRLEGVFDAPADVILATTGLVYISYIAVTKVASIAEEVHNPERNLTYGVFLAIGVCLLVYFLCVTVMVGVVPMEDLKGSTTPMASAAQAVLGGPGMAAIAAAAALAFFSVSNAGIMAASRYPLAMGRDDLLPGWFAKTNEAGTPIQAVLVTVASTVVVILLLDPLSIAKLASTFMLLMFATLCLAVIVMRESQLKSYDPGYRVPLYPALPVFGLLAPFALIAQMGLASTLFSLGLVGAGIAWYLTYAAPRVERRGALFHVFARWGEQRNEGLDTELRAILKEKGLRDQDPIDELLLGAAVLDVAGRESFENLVKHAADRLWNATGHDQEVFIQGFTEGTLMGATPVAKGVALPHMRLEGIERPEMVLVRCREQLNIMAGDVFGKTALSEGVHAIFFLVSPEEDPGQHLRLLAHLATRIDDPKFLKTWLSARTEVELREVFLRNERYISIELGSNAAAQDWIGCCLRDIPLPEGTLVAAIQRGSHTMVPRGSTELRSGDRLLIIGETEPIAALYETYG